jgi:hypothetical protein
LTEAQLMALATGSLAPQWELREPGRLQWEFDWLRFFGAQPRIDETALKSRAVWIDLEWVVDGETVPLRARFPDSYPRMRPLVNFRGERAASQRHVSPFEEGDICLLGRDSRQWTPDLGLGRLLDLQLKDALRDSGDQDPQGEPDEYWWNLIGVERSFILVDSAWEFSEHDSGYLRVRAEIQEGGQPRLRGWVRAVQNEQKQPLCKWQGPQPFQLTGQGLDLAVHGCD